MQYWSLHVEPGQLAVLHYCAYCFFAAGGFICHSARIQRSDRGVAHCERVEFTHGEHHSAQQKFLDNNAAVQQLLIQPHFELRRTPYREYDTHADQCRNLTTLQGLPDK